MIESNNNIFKTVVDKIDYDNFIDLVKKYQDKYNMYIKYSNSFDCFSYDEDLSFNIYINQDAELTLDDREDNFLFFTINSKIKTNNIFTQFLGGKLSDSDFIEKLRKLVENYNNRKISKIKKSVLSKQHFRLSTVRDSEEESLIYLLDDSFLIKLSKEENIYPSYFYDFLTRYKKKLGSSYIIKFNNFINYGSNINYFINKENLIHKDCDTVYFKEETKKLFEYLEEFPNELVSFEQYYLIIYGLYFKLFPSEELHIINQLFKNTNQLYVYDDKRHSDFNKEFVGELLLNNNIDLKFLL